jgi:NTP pyrophosphatase (non-canonical NTP hydrolase)
MTMTKKEHLLSCLAEEAGELVQACGKALRFGLLDGHPERNESNEDDILCEIAHIKAIANMLALYSRRSEDTLIAEKIIKVKEYMLYAEHRKHQRMFRLDQPNTKASIER